MSKKYWISVKRGLSEDPKHREQMGDAVWLFLHIIDSADWETGTVYDWTDADIAADMSMNQRTLRDWRERLTRFGYITCIRRPHGLNITIHNWTDPRSYSGKVINKSKNDTTVSIEEESEKVIDTVIDTQIDTVIDTVIPQNLRVNPALFIESKSKSKSKSNKKEEREKPDFVNLTVQEALALPELRTFRDATGRVPGQGQWETVWSTIRELNGKGNAEYLRPFWLEWSSRGWSASNLAWLTEWAVEGAIPPKDYARKDAKVNRKAKADAEFFAALREQ